MNPTTLEARAWEGLFSLLVWIVLTALAGLVRFPGWAVVAFPIPSLLIVLDALSPSPRFVHWGVRLGPKASVWLSTGLTAIALTLGGLALAHPTPSTDQPPVITCAARNLWHGIDPYSTYEPQCLSQLQLNSAGATPLEAGPFRTDSRYPSQAQVDAVLRQDQRDRTHAGFPAFGYPPDAPLLILPVAYAGWLGISVWVGALSALLLFGIWGRRLGALMPLVAWQLSALALLWVLYRWNPEELSYLILALAFARIDRARISSLALAAAICTNPLSWPSAVIYGVIISTLPQRRLRWEWLGGGIALGILPWLIWDHQLLKQLWKFLSLQEFPLGPSLGHLARLPAQSHLLYLVGFLAGIALCAMASWRWPKWRWAVAVVVCGCFLLNWRGLLTYYLPIFWLSPAVVVGAYRLGQGLRNCPPTDPAPPAAGLARR